METECGSHPRVMAPTRFNPKGKSVLVTTVSAKKNRDCIFPAPHSERPKADGPKSDPSIIRSVALLTTQRTIKETRHDPVCLATPAAWVVLKAMFELEDQKPRVHHRARTATRGFSRRIGGGAFQSHARKPLGIFVSRAQMGQNRLFGRLRRDAFDYIQ